MLTKTKQFQVELKGDLLMIRNANGDLIKGMTVPVWNAIERFNAMVEKCKEVESKSK